MKIVRSATVPQSLNTFCKGVLKELSHQYEVVAVSSPGIALDEVGQREGVRTIAVPMQRHISLTKDLKSLWRMWRVLRKEHPDMIHSMTPKAGLISMMAGWLAGVPVRVHTFTGLVWPTSTGLKRRILMATDWLTCACATHVIPEGEGVKNDLLNHHITRKHIEVLGYGNVRGIDLDYYNPASIEVKHNEGFTFVFVGRIVRDKGINELVSAFDRLHAEHNDIRLILVGAREDNLDPVLPNTIERINRGDGIEAVGRQSDVRPFYAQADALVFPSYREGFPNVVIEAGAMGLPSIVTDINGSREIIIDGQNGVIIPSQDEEALYQAMKRFVEHPDEVAAMAAQARPLIASRYEQGYVRQCLYDYYHEILIDQK
ncbi:MAG: glycosyltransferase family 4 protein [Muribaculaceae bacterium]|nr:glycosyltransferase family 4 protein [Muribaculaceae bacterium]